MRRLRSPAILFAIASGFGCGGHHSMPDSQVPLDIPMRIVVTDGSVWAYLNAVDFGNCRCAPLTFPDVGSCSFITDAGPCNDDPYCHSCITDFGVEVDGQRLTPTGYGGNDPWARYYGSFPTGQLSLVVAGCGHPSTHIPLDGAAFPQATATADFVNAVPHVSWTTDMPSQSTLLTFSDGLHGDLCNAQGGASDFTFTGWMGGYSVGVQPFGSRADLETEFGMATIWRAGSAWAMFPPTP